MQEVLLNLQFVLLSLLCVFLFMAQRIIRVVIVSVARVNVRQVRACFVKRIRATRVLLGRLRCPTVVVRTPLLVV